MTTSKCLLVLALALAACGEDVRPSDTLIWQYYKKTNGLASDDIYSLLEDKSGRIWVGTNKGVTVYDGTKYTTYNRTTGLSDDVINSITEAANGDVWLGTNKGVNIFRNNQWLAIPQIANITINGLTCDSDNLVWMATYGYGILKYSYTSATIVQYFDNVCSSCNYVNVVYQSADKQLWAGSNADVKAFKGTSAPVSYTSAKNGIAGKSIWSIGEDSWGNLWFGSTDHAKVTRYRNGTFAQVSLSNNTVPSTNMVLDIQADNTGQLWFGVALNGLIEYDGVVMHKQFSGPPGSSISSLLKDRKGDMWVGTFGGGLGRFTPIKKSRP